MDEFSRTELLLGRDAMRLLKNARVAVFGLGGVGGHAAEALARSGVGAFSLFDGDVVDITNINRQIVASHHTVGRLKTDVMAERILGINPRARVDAHPVFYVAQNAGEYSLSAYSYVVDAIDTVTSKLLLAERAYAVGVPIISSMGAGNKLDPARFEVADLYQTETCPLARVMRRELKKRGVPSLKVVYSGERPVPLGVEGQRTLGSVAWAPPVAGLIMAGEVVRDLIRPV